MCNLPSLIISNFFLAFLITANFNSSCLYAENLDEVNALNKEALNLSQLGDHQNAIELGNRALKLAARVGGPDNTSTATIQHNLAQIYQNAGDYEKSINEYKKALVYRIKLFGEKNEATARTMNNLASVYFSIGDYKTSIFLHGRALEIRLKVLGANHTDTALSLNNIGTVYDELGEYQEALNSHQMALKIRQNILGKEHTDTAQSLNNIAHVYVNTGDYPKALHFYENAYAIRKNTLGEKHPDTARIISNIGSLYGEIGDYDQAIKFTNNALTILNQKYDAKSTDVVAMLNNLAYFAHQKNDFNSAIEIYHKNLLQLETKSHSYNVQSSLILHNLSAVYSDCGELPKAIQTAEKSLNISKEIEGNGSLNTILRSINLAYVYSRSGKYNNAINLLESTLLSAENLLENDNKNIEIINNNLAANYYIIGNHAAALKYCMNGIKVINTQLAVVLCLDEKSRLSWQVKNLHFWTACILKPHEIAQLALNWKGVILDSILDDRAVALVSGNSAEGAKNLQKIAELRSRFSKIVLDQGREKEKSDLESQIGLLQRSLAQNYLGREMQRPSLNLTMRDITPALAGGVILLDFIHYRDPKIKDQDSQCLGIIITGEDNKPILVRIDKATDIHRAIAGLRESIKRGDAEAVQQFTSTLSKKLWAPIAAKIPQQVNRLIISPDGELNFLSFAALLDARGKFLAETYDISYVGSARDLVRETKSKSSRTICLFANPAFQRDPVKVDDMQYAVRPAEIDIFGQLQLPSLPGTEKESTEIQKIASEAGWNFQTYTREQADEATLRQTKKPGILHLATHGFYLNSFTPAPLDSRGMSVIGIDKPKPSSKGVDPMRASGIALAGAQCTLKSWSERKAPAPETDGVLTAEEVAALDLDGTWLVTLSACETGVGEARSGEGVFGLRRSFMIAGAENLLMTLWPVRDKSTAEIMADFYREALKTGNAPGSLAKVQREWLVKLRKEKGLLEAVRDAGPFVMATIGKPLPPLPREPTEEPSILDNVTQKIESLIKSSNTDIKNN
jgi:CHAT domain-containing protein/Tfp pilus assembly protein PilF